MFIPFVILSLYGLGLICAILLLIQVYNRRQKEKELEETKHKDYKDY